jgi:DNA-binding beta-propeller fold protein YncE
VASSKDGSVSFVAVPNRVVVLSDARPAPAEIYSIPLPEGVSAAGESVSADGRYLLVAAGNGAVVLDASLAARGRPTAILGSLQAADSSGAPPSAIEALASPDDRFAFVSLEYADAIAVFDLRGAVESGFRRSGAIGLIPLGRAVVGMAVSPDGRWLYATSELANTAGVGQGTISVIDLAKAELSPSASVVASAPAGCGPVRVVVSADGSTVWVSARESDAVLGFSAPRLRASAPALISEVPVGEAPVGLALVDGGRFLVVADSNRFGAASQEADLAVVDVSAALARRPALLGTIKAGGFPREMSLEGPRGVLLVANYSSDQLETIDTSGLP